MSWRISSRSSWNDLAGLPYPWLPQQIVGASSRLILQCPTAERRSAQCMLIALPYSTRCVPTCTLRLKAPLISACLLTLQCTKSAQSWLRYSYQFSSKNFTTTSLPRCKDRFAGSTQESLFRRKALTEPPESQTSNRIGFVLHVEGGFGHCRKEKEWVFAAACHADGALTPWSIPYWACTHARYQSYAVEYRIVPAPCHHAATEPERHLRLLSCQPEERKPWYIAVSVRSNRNYPVGDRYHARFDIGTPLPLNLHRATIARSTKTR